MTAKKRPQVPLSERAKIAVELLSPYGVDLLMTLLTPDRLDELIDAALLEKRARIQDGAW